MKNSAKTKSIKCPVCSSIVEVPKASNMPEFIGYAKKTYKERFGEELVFGKKQAGIIVNILSKIELNALKIYWHWFINYTGRDWYISNATKDISGFGTNINRIAQMVAPSIVKASGEPPRALKQDRDRQKTIIEEDSILLEAKENMFEYFNSVIEPESPDYDRWAEKFDNTQTLAELEAWDNDFQQWRRRAEPGAIK
jgi:hypothetical protein